VRAGSNGSAGQRRNQALRFVALGMLAIGLVAPVAASNPLQRAPADAAVTVDTVIADVDAGRFAEASSKIERALVGQITAPEHEALEFERERMRRILLDFSHDEEEMLARLRRYVPDVRPEEVERWKRQGVLEHRVIDGRVLYFNRAVPNLFRLSEEAAARRNDPKPFSQGPMESLDSHHSAVRAAAVESGSTSVLPRRVRVKQTISVEADAVPAGEPVRAWIPYPREIEGQQEDIQLLASEPKDIQVADPSTMQRTVHFEKVARAGQPVEFSVEYELTLYARYHDIDPDKVQPAPATAELATHLGERPPHIVFTPAIREFSARIVGDEKNPYRIARKLFAAVDQIPWAGAREYSTISNISEHALQAGHADCGQQTLLLMTLLRLNGIPARWQSGMVYSDGDYWNLHDWGWLYLAPYGWVPMDVTTGRFKDAADAGDEDLEWFYLGGLDAYRIAFNDDYGTPLQPSKQHFRSETVDSQRGEVEWSGGNLYFDQWDYGFRAQVVPGEPAR